ncbi:precorrin-6A reductase [Intestinibacter sp.]|uniref:precorrin-6A reductase n=1 Tax=Intestinibacter sp. TaxID=1965304 RepID=UPI003AB41CDF
MILVLGGTSDSIGICNKLNEMNLPYMVSVTTEYGRDIAKKATENVFLGKLTIEDMVSLIKEKNITQIIDATHPYATIVSSNAIECSKISNTDYVRFERESLIKQIDYDDIYVVKDIEQACEIANEKGNNIFIGTGSKNLDKYIELIKGKKLIARVLPTSDVLKSCEELGLNADNIIAMKGPFTEEINIATYRQYDIDLLITKESGVAGGFLEKINACKALNIPAVIITRKQIDYPKVINRIEDIEKIV